MDEKSILKSKKFSVFSTLISIINENEVDDSNYILASYILDNFDNLKKLNIYDTAEDCYVSRSSVRRFCKYIGLGSFAELKKCSDEWDHQKNKYSQIICNYSKKNYLLNTIVSHFNVIDKAFSSKKLDYIAELIHKSNNVFIMSSEFSGGSLYEFQQAMFVIGKPIKLMTSSYLNENVFGSLNGDDVVITISVTGVYAYSTTNLLYNKPCYKLLLTSEKDSNLSKIYNEIIEFGIKLSPSESMEFSKYAIGYLLDKLLVRYARLYKK